MARKSTRKKTTKKQDIERHERNKRLAIGAGILLAGGGVFVGAAMGLGELDRKASAYVVRGNPQVEIDWPMGETDQPWLPLSERDRLESLLTRAAGGGQGLSQAPLAEVGYALMKSGWVDGTPTVRWTGDGRIVVDADWRVPAGAVRVGTREVLIDWKGVVLPLDYAIGESNQRFFINVDAAMPEEGKPWLGTDLQDGLALLELLSDEGLLEQVEGFDLGEGPDSGTIKIITVRGSEVIWGAGPGRIRPGEVPTSQKVDRLRMLYGETGLIDAGWESVDIRGDDILSRRKEG
ncbi:MAG: hypothetical protein ACWA5W_06930 [Phycisphaerales bacterium]